MPVRRDNSAGETLYLSITDFNLLISASFK
nr:MAG TPA: hypothetical protein [Caudoviricetes sp.]